MRETTELNYAMSGCYDHMPFTMLPGTQVEHPASGLAKTADSVAMVTGLFLTSVRCEEKLN